MVTFPGTNVKTGLVTSWTVTVCTTGVAGFPLASTAFQVLVIV